MLYRTVSNSLLHDFVCSPIESAAEVTTHNRAEPPSSEAQHVRDGLIAHIAFQQSSPSHKGCKAPRGATHAISNAGRQDKATNSSNTGRVVKVDCPVHVVHIARTIGSCDVYIHIAK